VAREEWSVEQHGFRALSERWRDIGDGGLREILLGETTLAQARVAMRHLEKYRDVPAPRETPEPEWSQEELWDLWELYALSRLNDRLLLDQRDTWIPRAEPRLSFFGALGFEAFHTGDLGDPHIAPFPYSPFHHEIVHVDITEEATDVEVFRVEWPGLRWGNLLFARAGVSVRAPPGQIDPFVAERSVLYFAYRRFGRWTSDRSMGWGHNSQWRTQFHRFYEDAEHYYFNVDGSLDLASQETLERSFARWRNDSEREDPGAELPLACRRELLIHRHFVTCRRPDTDLWPWEDTLTLPKG
jgi:hypothetical protein